MKKSIKNGALNGQSTVFFIHKDSIYMKHIEFKYIKRRRGKYLTNKDKNAILEIFKYSAVELIKLICFFFLF